MFRVILCLLIAEINCYYDDYADYWFDGRTLPKYIPNQRSQSYVLSPFSDITQVLTSYNPKLDIELVANKRKERNLAEAAPFKVYNEISVGGKTIKERLGFNPDVRCHICNHYCIC